MLKNTNTSYGSVSKFFHWLVFILVAGLLTVGFLMGDTPEAYKGMVYNYHKLTGLTVLCLMLLRLLWTIVNTKPELPQEINPLAKFAARSVHWLLYLVIIAMPLAGWIGSSSAGKYPYIGNWQLALPIEKSKSLIETSFDIHEFLAFTIITLVSIHILAALYHHFIRKDNVLRRMLPW